MWKYWYSIYINLYSHTILLEHNTGLHTKYGELHLFFYGKGDPRKTTEDDEEGKESSHPLGTFEA